MKKRELSVTLGRELGTDHLKNINIQLKSQNCSNNLSLTINNSDNKKDNNDNLTKFNSNYKLIYNHPINENFKLKVNIEIY
jgi:hypothetical protein